MAELIQRTDSLNTGREKLNEAIKASDRAEDKADYAVDTANQALNKSESTQTQLDTIVIDGDSSVEAAQARVDTKNHAYDTLKQRLDTEYTEVTSQLAQTDDRLTKNEKKVTFKVSVEEFDYLIPNKPMYPDPKDWDWTQAIKAAMEIGGEIIMPDQEEILVTETLELKNNSVLQGAGWHTNDSVDRQTKLVFAVPDGGPAIKTIVTGDNQSGLGCGIFNMEVVAKNWTEHKGYGIELEERITMYNVHVTRFPKSNIFFHNNENGRGPYQSLLVNVTSSYSKEHGFLIGTGANALTLINCSGRWNGATEYGKAPTVAGNYHGLYSVHDREGNPNGEFYQYTQEFLTLIGGDFSYNSGYGVNLESLRRSNITIGYCEHNLTNDIRFGLSVSDCHINVTVARIDRIDFEGVNDNYSRTNSIFVGGTYVGGTNGERLNYLLDNMESFLSSSENYANVVRFVPEENGNLRLATTGVAELEIGNGTHSMKVSNNKIVLPRRHYRFNGEYENIIDYNVNPPSSGERRKGDVVYNTNPQPGAFVGWVCIESGNPGVWKGFGKIQE